VQRFQLRRRRRRVHERHNINGDGGSAGARVIMAGTHPDAIAAKMVALLRWQALWSSMREPTVQRPREDSQAPLLPIPKRPAVGTLLGWSRLIGFSKIACGSWLPGRLGGHMTLPTRYPLFIVGSPRSGTSILIDALRGAGYHGFSEGNFLTLLQPIQRLIDRHFEIFDASSPNVLVSQIDKSVLTAELHRVVCQAAEAQYGNRPWVDKTGNPEMIAAIPIMLHAWPTSHFIFAKRRAIENVYSRLRKFPKLNFDYHCADWARNMAAWRQIKAEIPDLRAIEIDQREISAGPAEAAGRLAAFLALGDDAARRMTVIFETNRPQQTQSGSAERLLRLETTGWTDEQVRVFHKYCDIEMEAFGYSLDESYVSDTASDLVV
jgi:hypothetical protein